MSRQSTTNGKAYEYATIKAFCELVSSRRPISIIPSNSLIIAKNMFDNCISDSDRQKMLSSAKAGVKVIIDMEPRIIEDGSDELTVSIQSDDKGKTGDIRDVLIIRRHIQWEIGVSVKHNHAALKHSRLSEKLDFGSLWYGIPSSKHYFDEVSLIFEELKTLKTQKMEWRNLDDKEGRFYTPILNAFMSELNRANSKKPNIVTAGIIKYLIGSNGKDYYKLIHFENNFTRVIPYNLYGTLFQSNGANSAALRLNDVKLPTRIIQLAFKANSKTTLELTMDNGWSISFRIHNASRLVEPSLKFDIQLIGQPADLHYKDASW